VPNKVPLQTSVHVGPKKTGKKRAAPTPAAAPPAASRKVPKQLKVAARKKREPKVPRVTPSVEHEEVLNVLDMKVTYLTP
jgi:hypothetical protein